VVIQFVNRGETISVKALFKRSGSGRCYLVLDPQATPLSQRRFVRLGVSIPVRLAAVSPRGFGQLNLNKLRWMGTDGVNLSGGGMLITLPSMLEKNIYLLLNLQPEQLDFPPLILGRVCHCYPDNGKQHRVGIEFVIGEAARRLFPESVQRQLPAGLFEYTAEKRKKLDSKIVNLKITRSGDGTGVSNESES